MRCWCNFYKEVFKVKVFFYQYRWERVLQLDVPGIGVAVPDCACIVLLNNSPVHLPYVSKLSEDKRESSLPLLHIWKNTFPFVRLWNVSETLYLKEDRVICVLSIWLLFIAVSQSSDRISVYMNGTSMSRSSLLFVDFLCLHICNIR